MAIKLLKDEYCINDDVPASTHCRKCGAPLCATCGKYGICQECNREEAQEENMDNAYEI